MWVWVIHTAYADLAHLVERDLAKVEVAGSSPVIRLKRVSEKVLAFCFPLSDLLYETKQERMLYVYRF